MKAVSVARGRWTLGLLAALALAAVIAMPAARALAQDGTAIAGPVVTVDATGGDVRAFGASVTVGGAAANVRAAGASVEVAAKAAGSVWVFGGKVVLGGDVAADVAAAGSSVSYSGHTGGDARVAGGSVSIDATIGGSLRACAANLTVGSLTEIAGSVGVVGANLSVAGHIAGDAKLAGAVVTFNGQADKSLTIVGDTVVVGPQARIGGDLTVYSRHAPEIADTAVIGGTVKRMEPPAELSAVPDWAWSFGFAIAMVLGIILAGIVLMLFGGRLFISALDHARLRPVSTIIIGIVTLILVPAVAALLSATVVGLPIGFALMLALPLLFVFGLPVAAAGIAAGIFVRTPGPVGIARGLLFVIVGAVILALIGLIPWVGCIAVGVVTVLGAGALVRTAGGRLRTPEAQRPALMVAAPPRPAAAPPPSPPLPPPPPPAPEPPAPPAVPEKPEQPTS
jgi:hypothetical protein